ncbi:MAG: alpha-ketoglutarate-dependent dioxygenase AlkB [Gammaproteobacteria bacterium]|nr:alpha-ketoglutarate-dependent dioxygenase AlkB [Gammaproteobacteria bacterium]MXW06606.1 alpha-ketoglutarate-dependent dioxygenase AlkB [Gammaproteobacteria bacterium]MYC25391.1 alpha-ketoglutarate-dependent dioxygenase AlkB [Gammaproteobacteria bacterium]
MSRALRSDHTVTSESNGLATPVIQKDGVVMYLPGFLSPAVSDQLLARSLAEIAWAQDHIKLFGKSMPVPRLSAWFSSVSASYKYSGVAHQPQEMPDFVRDLLVEVMRRTGINFNSMLVNLYQDGTQSMGWHADDEPELGPDVTIASLSVGAERELRFRHRYNKDQRLAISLEHGSLLMMYPPLQEYWLHELPKRRSITEPRINFSFRVL